MNPSAYTEGQKRPSPTSSAQLDGWACSMPSAISIFLGHLNATPQICPYGAASGLQSKLLARISQTLSAEKLWRASDRTAAFALKLETDAVLDSESIHGLHCFFTTEIATVITVIGVNVPAVRRHWPVAPKTKSIHKRLLQVKQLLVRP